jgi:hypothetical protein
LMNELIGVKIILTRPIVVASRIYFKERSQSPTQIKSLMN